MTILKDVIAELAGMFLADARLSATILGVVAVAAASLELASAPGLVGGALLLFGCLAALMQGVRREARQRRRGA